MTITRNGPYLVSGKLPLAKEIIVFDEKEGCPTEWEQGDKYPDKDQYALCRCGQSKTKPYCDGTHVKAKFDGTETATRKEFMDQAEAVGGKDIALLDVKHLCSRARFCHQSGGAWKVAYEQNDEASRDLAEHIAGQCPAGRLVIMDKKTEETVEPHFEPSVSLVEDPDKGVSGPIWLKGGIPLYSADGKKYETRNRVTLCRCGESDNKPYCDGSHIESGFNDGDAALNK